MRKIAVFHFNPLELYPPAMNFLDCLQRSLAETDQVWVYTTRPAVKTELYIPSGNQIIIKRIASYTQDLVAIKRMFQYLRYYLLSFLQCVRFSPSKVFYYETISSLTPYLLMRWSGNRIETFIHYHEYMNAGEYARMILNKIFHRLESRIYRKAKWISHTNPFRMQLFLEDLGNPTLTNTHIFPNYPPAAWISSEKVKITKPVKMVYVGAMGSLDLLYIREIFEWVRALSGEAVLDIYSFKVADEIRLFSEEMHCPYINWKTPVNYKELPRILKQYDVGVILYKGISANNIYNAPNKLFEYLACGLDVWYPQDLEGSHEYNSTLHWPKVLALNFLRLGNYNICELIERKADRQRQINYTCEKACRDLVTLISA